MLSLVGIILSLIFVLIKKSLVIQFLYQIMWIKIKEHLNFLKTHIKTVSLRVSQIKEFS